MPRLLRVARREGGIVFVSIHANAVNCVRLSSDTIMPLQIRIPRIGTRGTAGVRNGRCLAGSVRHRSCGKRSRKPRITRRIEKPSANCLANNH